MTANAYGCCIFYAGSSVNSSFPQMLTDLATLGATWVRVQFNWNDTETSQGVYAWTGLDDMVNKANTAGINVCLSADNPPTWALANTSQKATNEPFYLPDPTSTSNFLTSLATRYNGSNGHGSIQALEIGNEGFNNHFTASGLGIRSSPYTEYNGVSGVAFNIQPARDPYFLASVLAVAVPNIRAAYPSLIIGLAAIWWFYAPNYSDFLDGIYSDGRLTNAKSYFDYVNLHYYTPVNSNPFTNSPRIDIGIASLITVMNTYGDTSKTIWITEFGYATTSVNQSNPIAQQEQTYNYRYTLDCARNSGRVSHMFFYTLDYHNDGMSLVQGTGPYTYLPAFTALQSYISAYPTFSKGSAHFAKFML